MGDCPLPCLLEGILSILHSSGGCFHSFCRHKLYLHLGLRSQLNNYVTMYMIVYVIMLYIITYTHINYYIQLCDTFKPPISTGVLVVPGGTLILLKNRKAADGQDNFSESEREREKFRVAGSVWFSMILWILWMQATVSLWTLACSSAC